MSDYTINTNHVDSFSYEDLIKEMSSKVDSQSSGVVGMINKNGLPVSLFEFKHNSIDNILDIIPTVDGQYFLMSAFGQPAVSGQLTSISLSDISPNVLRMVFGQNNTNNKDLDSFGDFIERAKETSGSFLIADNINALTDYAKRTMTLKSSSLINSKANRFGSALETSNGTLRRFIADTYDTGATNGLNGVRVEGVRSNLSSEMKKNESDRLAFEHAAHYALAKLGLESNNFDFKINPETGLGLRLTYKDDIIVNASKNENGFTHRNAQWKKQSLQLSFTDLKSLKTGREENQTVRQSTQQVYHYLKNSNVRTKEFFITQLMLRKLIGGEPINGNNIKFEGDIKNGKLHLKLLPLAGLTPDLMHNPSHADLMAQNMKNKALNNITLVNILADDPALLNIYNVEPDLIKKSFVYAIKARKDMVNYIQHEMKPNGLISSASANDFRDYLARLLTVDGEYHLKTEAVGSADNNHEAMKRLLERNLITDLANDSQLNM